MQPGPLIYGLCKAVLCYRHKVEWLPRRIVWLTNIYFLTLYRKTLPTPLLGQWGWGHEAEGDIQFRTFSFCSSRSCPSRVHPRRALRGEDLYPVETAQWDQWGHHALRGKEARCSSRLLWLHSIDFSQRLVNTYSVQSSAKGMKVSGTYRHSGKATQRHTVELSQCPNNEETGHTVHQSDSRSLQERQVILV